MGWYELVVSGLPYVEGNEFNCPEVILSVKSDENLTVTDV